MYMFRYQHHTYRSTSFTSSNHHLDWFRLYYSMYFFVDCVYFMVISSILRRPNWIRDTKWKSSSISRKLLYPNATSREFAKSDFSECRRPMEFPRIRLRRATAKIRIEIQPSVSRRKLQFTCVNGRKFALAIRILESRNPAIRASELFSRKFQ